MSAVGGEVERTRRISLFCPAVSKGVQIVEREEQKLDLGSISRAFGLDPNTLKLNGHFISRGADSIAYSVTWKSLIGFFSHRGLSTGATGSDAIIVDGGLCKIGSKRARDLADNGKGVLITNEQGYSGISKKPQLEFGNMVFNEKIEETTSGADQPAGYNGSNGLGLKRKLWSEDCTNVKRSRPEEAAVPGFHQEGNGRTSTNRGFSCSFISNNLKRMRDDEMVDALLLKKMRQ